MGSQCSTCAVVCQKDRQEVVNEHALSIIMSNQNCMSQQSSSMLKNDLEGKHKKNNYYNQDDKDYNAHTVDQVVKIQALYRGFSYRKSSNKFKGKSGKQLNPQCKTTSNSKSNQNTKASVTPPEIKISNSLMDKQQSLESIDSRKIRMYRFDEKELEEIKKQNITGNMIREKRGLYKFQSGATYQGEWVGNEKSGYGIQIWPDHARYEGQWNNNRANGKGKFYHADGDEFDGTWVDDQAQGYGIYQHSNSNVYKGYWKADQQHGYGVEVWMDNSKYEGEYYEGKKQGRGRYFWPDGSNYDGDWYGNMLNGYGTYSWMDGRGYEGSWMYNKMHGKGVYSWKDGRKYEGEYQEDKKQGWGIYTWVDGRKYEGNWADGKQHGQGKYLQEDGKYRIGLWEKGKRTQWVDDPQ